MSINSKKDIKSLLSSDKARVVFIVVGLCAIFLIFLSSRGGSEGKENYTQNFDTETYRATLTTEITQMVESVDGIGKTKVLLTLENSYEYVYLDDDKTLKKVNEPTIRGVVVACEGGGSSVLSAKITELVSTALNIPSSKVCVTKLI